MERDGQNSSNAKQQKCPHTMGRKSAVQRQQAAGTEDRLLLWKMNRLYKDGTWTLQDASQKWAQSCQLLVASDLTPESGNLEENERVFIDVMGPKHSGRVRCKGLGVSPSRYHHHSSPSTACTGASRNSSSMQQIVNLQGEIGEMRQEQGHMKQGMTQLGIKMDQVLELLMKQSQGTPGPPPPDDEMLAMEHIDRD